MSYYGVVEGFYGWDWGWQQRNTVLHNIASSGYRFYIYAPKSAKFLRDDWEQPWPEGELNALTNFFQQCKDLNVAPGIGFSPLSASHDFNLEKQLLLKQKLDHINALQPTILAVLLDDMQVVEGDVAHQQLGLLDFIMSHSKAEQFIFCPSYYSHDPILEKLFGPRPKNYWENLGRGVAKECDIFWTGQRIMSQKFSCEMMDEMANIFQRKPALWDNYPVNDSPGTSDFLHLGAFTGYPSDLPEHLSLHAVNPMKQALLSCIPLHTLGQFYKNRQQYEPDKALENALKSFCSPMFAEALSEDIKCFQEEGLAALSEEQRVYFYQRYQNFQDPAVAELLAWLKGDYKFNSSDLPYTPDTPV